MDAGGGLPVFQSANTAAVQQQHIHLQQQQHLHSLQQQQNINLHLQQQQQIHNVQQQQQQQQQSVYHSNTNNNQQPNSGGDATPKNQAVIDRLRLRLGKYRNRTREATPRFDQTFKSECEAQNQDALALQKRMLDSKAKRAKQKINPADKQKQPDNLLNVTNSSVHVVSFYIYF